jgi:hypothetical protein
MSKKDNKHKNDTIYENKQDSTSLWCDLWCEPWFDCNLVNKSNVDKSLASIKLDGLEDSPPSHFEQTKPETKVTSVHVNKSKPITDHLDCINEVKTALAPPKPITDHLDCINEVEAVLAPPKPITDHLDCINEVESALAPPKPIRTYNYEDYENDEDENLDNNTIIDVVISMN